ncbi:MAG: hypothetical protein AAGE94_06235 [Acidobacteriota bacterium]
MKKLALLDTDPVQTTSDAASLVTLDAAALADVVGAGAEISTSICEIHFYYPADGAA